MSKAVKKKCVNCGDKKSLDAFHAMTKANDGRQSYCKKCMKKLSKHRNWKRQGIDMTDELYGMIDEANDYRCAICERSPDEVAGQFRELSVDHDHTSGKTRNLLCGPCNQAIGLFQEAPERMRIAADYVEFYYASEVLDPHDPRPLDNAPARAAVQEFLEWHKNRASK